jgi:hypothetical protein
MMSMSMRLICNDAPFQESLALPAPANGAGAGQPSRVTDKTIDKIEEQMGASGGNLVYGGYPYDPFMLDTAKH